jgi:hypothetical protein
MVDKMKEKNIIILGAVICATLIICGILYWPTLYRYDKIEGKMPIRVNRITGYTEILYRGHEWKPVKNVQTIPQNERDKVTILGDFNINGQIYNGEIYNGTSYTLKKIRLSIGAKNDSGIIEWQKRYETPIDIPPYSKGFCSIGLIDTKYFYIDKEKLENKMEYLDPGKPKYTKNELIDKAIGYAKEYAVRPNIYLSLINQVSEFNPDAKSPTGVRGISQIPLEKGKAYGIMNNEDRANPDKMLRAGAAYLRDLFDEKGNWSDAVFAYNGGSDPDFKYHVGRHLPWARQTLADRRRVPVGPAVPLLRAEVKLEEIFGYKGE